MNFFIDFEATQPENEIIAIGVAAENGATFYSLVKPQLSSISKQISQMTHISSEDLEKAPGINQVLRDFDLWLMLQEPNIMECRFIAYGDDSKFIKSTLPAITEQHAFTVAAILMAKIENCYENTRKFFHGPIKLVHAFNFVQSMSVEQQHDPLEDALMLQKVFEYTQINEPLIAHPFNPNHPAVEVKMPSGNFWCIKSGKRRDFATCEDAIEWLIYDEMKMKNPEQVHRDRIMKNIMKAIRTKKCYCSYKWYRKKEEE